MITQQHENEIQQKAQAPSPVKEQRWRVALFSILGVALPLVAGSMVKWPWGGVPEESAFFTVILAIFVSVAVGAFLLCFAFRAWWVSVFAGVAWIVGEFLASVVRPLVEGGWPALQGQWNFWGEQEIYISLALAPLLLGMALGAAGGFALGKRRASRQ
jgi:predicted anti-sigma-YlaC factor YlaD